MAVFANAIECVRLLLPLETRRYYRLQALREAILQHNMEIAHLLLAEDDSDPTPLTMQERAISFVCIRYATCPLLVDSLLTLWCPSKLQISELHATFTQICGSNRDTSVLHVFLAHGIDLAEYVADGNSSATSSLLAGAIRGSNFLPQIAAVQCLLESGAPSVTVDKSGRTPEQNKADELARDYLVADKYRGLKRRLFGQCRDLFAARSAPSDDRSGINM